MNSTLLGSFTDAAGLRRALLLGFGICVVARAVMTFAPTGSIALPSAFCRWPLLALFGLVLGVGARRLGPSMMLPLASAVMLLYIAAAYYAFSIHHRWLPLVIPLSASRT